MKIIYHVGESIGSETIVKRGNLIEDIIYPSIQSTSEKIVLDSLNSIEFFKLNGLGTMVKIRNSGTTIYFSVTRIFIDKGAGFAIVNYSATKKVKALLEVAMKNQLNKF